MICLMCRKELFYAMDAGHVHKPSRMDAIDNGGTVEVSFGYGSRLDCQTALGYVCDACFDGNRDLFVNHYNVPPSMTDLMVAPETIAEFISANPPTTTVENET